MGIEQASSMGIGGAWEASSVRGQALLASGMSVAASGAMEQHEQRARSMGIENGHGHNMGSEHHGRYSEPGDGTAWAASRYVSSANALSMGAARIMGNGRAWPSISMHLASSAAMHLAASTNSGILSSGHGHRQSVVSEQQSLASAERGKRASIIDIFRAGAARSMDRC